MSACLWCWLDMYLVIWATFLPLGAVPWLMAPCSGICTCACVFHLCGVCACVSVRSHLRWWVQRLPDCYWLHLCCNQPRDGAPNPIFEESEPHSPPMQANRRAGHFHPDLTRKQHTMLLAGKYCWVLWNRSFYYCTNIFSIYCSVSYLSFSTSPAFISGKVK